MAKPRILCLHGGGANASVFRVQCRALCQALRDEYRFVWVEAPFYCDATDAVQQVYPRLAPFRRWLRWLPEQEAFDAATTVDEIFRHITEAMQDDDREVQNDGEVHNDGDGNALGPWVGLLGFSQGAKVAASILWAQQAYQQQREQKQREQKQREQKQREHHGEGLGNETPDENSPPSPTTGYPLAHVNFQFAVLMAGRAPLVWLDVAGPGSTRPRYLADAADISLDYVERQNRENDNDNNDDDGQNSHEDGSQAADGNAEETEARPTTASDDEAKGHPQDQPPPRLRIPTIHVHGRADPGLERHRDLYRRYCDPAAATVIEWEGAHRVPLKSDIVRAIAQAVRDIRTDVRC